MSVFSKIRPLQSGEKIVDDAGGPSLTFQRLWQQLAANPEILEGTKQDADSDLDGLSDLATTGIAVRIGGGLWSTRTLQNGTNITITNPDGVAGDPVINCTVTGFTDEAAQDSIGTILVDSATIDFTYDDATPSITAIVKAGSIGATELSASGVVAGSYGDASNVANFTVDADGRITAAANVPITGSGTGTGGVLPVVDGSIPPNFIQNPDGTLVYTPI